MYEDKDSNLVKLLGVSKLKLYEREKVRIGGVDGKIMRAVVDRLKDGMLYTSKDALNGEINYGLSKFTIYNNMSRLVNGGLVARFGVNRLLAFATYKIGQPEIPDVLDRAVGGMLTCIQKNRGTSWNRVMTSNAKYPNVFVPLLARKKGGAYEPIYRDLFDFPLTAEMEGRLGITR